jgi:hypothetical protein
MRPSGEDLDGFESVAGNVGQVLARQTAFVEEMSGDAEAVVRQPLMISGSWLLASLP